MNYLCDGNILSSIITKNIRNNNHHYRYLSEMGEMGERGEERRGEERGGLELRAGTPHHYNNDEDRLTESKQTISKYTTMKRQLLIPAGLFIVAIFIIQIRYDRHLLTIHTVIFDAQSKQSNTRRFEPFVNRWQHKFDDRDRDGYLFFKHIRKAGESMSAVANYFA